MSDKFKKLLKNSSDFVLAQIKKINFPVIRHKISRFFRSWWQLIAILFACILFLYYPIGGLLVEDIYTYTDIEIVQNRPELSSEIDMMSFIINREVSG